MRSLYRSFAGCLTSTPARTWASFFEKSGVDSGESREAPVVQSLSVQLCTGGEVGRSTRSLPVTFEPQCHGLQHIATRAALSTPVNRLTAWSDEYNGGGGSPSVENRLI